MRLRIFTEPQQGASYDELLAVASTAEDCGFDAFFRSDHCLKMGGVSGLPGPTDAWMTLAALGRETKTIRLGTLMTPITFTMPGPLAISVAQADAMSGGRVELGLGTGWYEAEHRAYGIPFPALAERFERLEETLEIVNGLWRTPPGQTYSFSGRHYVLQDSPALPKPVQTPRPRILLGGGGINRTPRLAARWADELNVPFRSIEDVAQRFESARRHCERFARDSSTLTFSSALVVCCGTDEAEVERRAAAIGREPAELRDNGLAGSPHDIVSKIESYAAVGVQTLYLQILDIRDLEHVRLLGAEVLPAVASAGAH